MLVGVSRTSKTPLSIYLGYLGHKAANVPDRARASSRRRTLFEIDRAKIVGLTIDAERLAEIREERVALDGRAAPALRRPREVFEELEAASRIHRRLGCPVIDVSELSVEETAMRIIRLVADRHRRRETAQA